MKLLAKRTIDYVDECDCKQQVFIWERAEYCEVRYYYESKGYGMQPYNYEAIIMPSGFPAAFTDMLEAGNISWEETVETKTSSKGE